IIVSLRISVSNWVTDILNDTIIRCRGCTQNRGTTATANNRVVEDIRQQLGDIVIQRSTLNHNVTQLLTDILHDSE
ncbi:hypothetical protein PS023_23340, partial [Shigella sonnei]|nr:hypothetical protein [Shigella sonnei]